MKALGSTELIKIFISFLVVYASLSQNYYLSNDGGRIALTYALVNNRSFIIDDYKNFISVDYSVFEEHTYADKPVGSSLLGIPAMLVIKTLRIDDTGLIVFLFTATTSALLSAVVCVILYRTAMLFSGNRKASILVVVAYGLGTMAFPFATIFMGHQTATFFAFSGFYVILLVKNKKLKDGYLILAGALTGFSFVVDYPLGIMLVLLSLYLLTFKRDRYFLMFITAMLAVASLNLLYNFICFKDPLAFPHKFQGYFTTAHTSGLYGVNLPQLQIVIELLFKEYRGLFIYSPILLFSLIGFAFFLKNKTFRTEATFCLLIFLSFLAFVSGYVGWYCGWSYGPRYLIPCLPFMSLLLLPVFERNKLFYAATPFLMLSIIIMTMGAFTNVIPGHQKPIDDAIALTFMENPPLPIGSRAFYFQKMLATGIPFSISLSIVLLLAMIPWHRDIIKAKHDYLFIVLMTLTVGVFLARVYPIYSVNLSDINKPKVNGTQWDQEGNFVLSRRGIEINLEQQYHSKTIEISLDYNDDYRIIYFNGDSDIGSQTIRASPTATAGLVVHVVEVPAGVAELGYDRVRVVPIGGDLLYSIGHILPE